MNDLFQSVNDLLHSLEVAGLVLAAVLIALPCLWLAFAQITKRRI